MQQILRSLLLCIVVLAGQSIQQNSTTQATNGTSRSNTTNAVVDSAASNITLPAFRLVQIPSNATRAKNCNADKSLCVTVTDLGSVVDFLVEGPSSAKYIGLGVGTSMVDSDIYVGYVVNGTFAVSSRRTLVRAPPTVLSIQTALAVRGGASVSSDRWISQFQRLKASPDSAGHHVDLAAPLSLVWAYNNKTAVDFNVAEPALRAKISKHTSQGKLSVDLKDSTQVAAAKLNSSSATTAPTTSNAKTSSSSATACSLVFCFSSVLALLL